MLKNTSKKGVLMMTESKHMNKPTKKQHYIPQVYLKGFSSDKPFVFAHWFTDENRISSKSVPIKTICVEKNLYEVEDKNGKIVLLNFVEKCLSFFEGKFARFFKDLERKAYNEKNLETKCFFTSDEKCFWRLFVALQMLRLPKVINCAKEFTLDYFDNSVSPNEAFFTAMKKCLPFFETLNEQSINCLSIVYNQMCKMSIELGVEKSGRIITSDCPCYFYSIDKSIECLEIVIFPISSNLVLVFHGGSRMKVDYKNRLFMIDDLQLIIKSIAYCADKMIISSHELSVDEKEWIIAARKDKTNDSSKKIKNDTE